MVNRIIAKNGDLILYKIDEDTGYVVNEKTGNEYEPHSIVSILSKGVWELLTTSATVRVKGGPTSGHHGHAGRPGKIGGSVPGRAHMVGGLASNRISKKINLTLEDAYSHIGYRPDPSTEAQAWEYEVNAAGGVGVDYQEFNNYFNIFIEDKPVSIRVSHVDSDKVLKDGRFKSQHEAQNSNGYYAPEERLHAEHRGLGAPKDLPLDKRPIYGYVPKSDTDRSASCYGIIEFVLKEDVKYRTTVNLGDSFGSMGEGRLTPRPFMSRDKSGSMHWLMKEFYFNKGKIGSYIEAQIHGGVTVRDISKIIVHFDEDPYRDRPPLASSRIHFEDIEKLATDYGIKVEYNE
jgi:hypothetical protein